MGLHEGISDLGTDTAPSAPPSRTSHLERVCVHDDPPAPRAFPIATPGARAKGSLN